MSAPESFETYATDREEARFTDWLRERSEPDWTATMTHRFVEDLGAGTLPKVTFFDAAFGPT